MNNKPINFNDFSPAYQDAIIGHMLQDNYFYLKCTSLLEKEWFSNITNQSLFVWVQELSQSKKGVPNSHELKALVYQKAGENRGKYETHINLCIAAAKNQSLTSVSSQMTGWIKLVKFQHCIDRAVGKFNSGDFHDAVDWTEKEIVAIRHATFMGDNTVDFNNTKDFLRKTQEEAGDCLTIGHPDFDKLLRAEAAIPDPNMDSLIPAHWTKGGLVKGNSTMILGASNSGKTTTLVSIIIANITNRKRILYITHEQKWEEIKLKLLKAFCGATDHEFNSINLDNLGDTSTPKTVLENRILSAEKFLHSYLTYVPWIKAGDMYVESVISEIKMKQEELMSRNEGKGFDMVVDDYPGKLRSRTFKSQSEHVMIDYVYDQFVNIAEEYRFHGIWPVQTNRDGYKVNMEGTTDNRDVGQADVAGSFGVMMKADNVITLNRKPAEIANNTMRYVIVKSRSAETGTTFATQTDFARSKTISPTFSSTVWNSANKLSIDAYQECIGAVPTVAESVKVVIGTEKDDIAPSLPKTTVLAADPAQNTDKKT